MNELGLSRESVRKIVEEIVVKTVDSHMDSLESSGRLNKIIEAAFNDRYRSYKFNDSKYTYPFDGILCKAAENAAAKFVEENLSMKAK